MQKYLAKSSESSSGSHKKYALFIGRWQPFHEGHQWLIDQKLKNGIPVCIAIRDVPKSEKNWWTADEIQKMLEERLQVHISYGMIKVIQIPDIESVNIGRAVGYDIIEHIPPTEIEKISATDVRMKMKNTNLENAAGLINSNPTVLTKQALDGDGRVLHEGDRVFSYDYDEQLTIRRMYGTLHKNEDFPHVSEWYVAYDDGEECAVLDMSSIFKA